MSALASAGLPGAPLFACEPLSGGTLPDSRGAFVPALGTNPVQHIYHFRTKVLLYLSGSHPTFVLRGALSC